MSKVIVIDLLSSSPEAPPSSSQAPRKLSHAYPKEKFDMAKPTAQIPPTSLPELSSLKAEFPTPESLYKQLDTLPKPTLIRMLLAKEGMVLADDKYKDALPGSDKKAGKDSEEEIDEEFDLPSRDPHHCVYCHQTYTPATDNWDCVVKHFGTLDWVEGYEEDRKEWSCCGKEVEGYADYDEDFMQPPHLVDKWAQYCWAGKHNARELEEGDDDAEEGSWWEGWEDSKRTCTDLGCHNKPIGSRLGKRTRV